LINLYKKRCICVIGIIFSMVSSPCWALQFILPDAAYQGDTIVGRILPPATVSVGGTICTVSPKGYFVIGVPRRQKTDLLVLARYGNEKKSRVIRILAYPWQIQRIDGLPERYVNPPPEALRRIKEDKEKVRAIRRAKLHPVPLFVESGFIEPVNGLITGIFGNQRILNGQPRSPHWGVDFAAPMGEPVYSPADGIVSLVAKDMYLMGNTLMVDHGIGVQSIFIHLNSIKVKKGDYVKQGSTIAQVGRTGRATGTHLHWGISVGIVPVDPARLIKKSFIIP
jgi:murein DD-endopeptidase MepM/ murein hydrolase activator NlpD